MTEKKQKKSLVKAVKILEQMQQSYLDHYDYRDGKPLFYIDDVGDGYKVYPFESNIINDSTMKMVLSVVGTIGSNSVYVGYDRELKTPYLRIF